MLKISEKELQNVAGGMDVNEEIAELRDQIKKLRSSVDLIGLGVGIPYAIVASLAVSFAISYILVMGMVVLEIID